MTPTKMAHANAIIAHSITGIINDSPLSDLVLMSILAKRYRTVNQNY